MNYAIVLCGIYSLAAAAAINEEAQAEILKYQNSNDGSGNYTYSFDTSNGIYREETGYIVNAGREDEHIVVEGLYLYTAVDGSTVVVRYKADENGFQIIPRPPPVKQSNRIGANVVATLLGK